MWYEKFNCLATLTESVFPDKTSKQQCQSKTMHLIMLIDEKIQLFGHTY